MELDPTEKPYVMMRSGMLYPLRIPRIDRIHIEDIAYHLARIARFNGATRGSVPYSVAEHSIWVSYALEDNPEASFRGLLHDGAEAYLGDVSAPLKRILPDYRGLERLHEIALRERFGIPQNLGGGGWGEDVLEADLRMCATEWAGLIDAPLSQIDLPDHIKPYENFSISAAIPANEAETLFILRYRSLTKMLSR